MNTTFAPSIKALRYAIANSLMPSNISEGARNQAFGRALAEVDRLYSDNDILAMYGKYHIAKEVLHSLNEVSFVYTKFNGQLRPAKGTLKKDLIPYKPKGKILEHSSFPYVIYWDTESEGFRTFLIYSFGGFVDEDTDEVAKAE